MTYKEASDILVTVDRNKLSERADELFGIARKAINKQVPMVPENAFKMYPRGILTYSGSCPTCGKPSNALSKYVQDKPVYQGISFCQRCGQALDWTGIISREELEEVE